MAAGLVMCLAGLLEYTWAPFTGSLSGAHHWSIGQTSGVLLLRHFRIGSSR